VTAACIGRCLVPPLMPSVRRSTIESTEAFAARLAKKRHPTPYAIPLTSWRFAACLSCTAGPTHELQVRDSIRAASPSRADVLLCCRSLPRKLVVGHFPITAFIWTYVLGDRWEGFFLVCFALFLACLRRLSRPRRTTLQI
jgi:hypothetical protein